jgi:flagellar motor protein MotB
MAEAPAQNSNPDPADPGNTTPPAPPAENGNEGPDLSKLPADQLVKALENPELFKLPRIKELLDASSQLKKLQADKKTADETALKDQNKFKELAETKETENSSLKEQIKTMEINQQLTAKLVPLGVLDLEGALKLVDRSKIEMDESGQITGLDEALTALQTDKNYLFTKGGKTVTVGGPTNPDQAPSGPAKFKRSQLRDPKFYQEHREEILAAQKEGLIEDDINPAPQR